MDLMELVWEVDAESLRSGYGITLHRLLVSATMKSASVERAFPSTELLHHQ